MPANERTRLPSLTREGPRAQEQLRPCDTTTEPGSRHSWSPEPREPGLHTREVTAARSLCPTTGEEPCALSSNKDPAQPKLNGFKNKIHTDAEKLLLRKRGDGVRCRVIKQQACPSPKNHWLCGDLKTAWGCQGKDFPDSRVKPYKLDRKASWAWCGQVCQVAGVGGEVESVRSCALWGCEKGFGFAKGRFHARMGTIKDRNGMDPREAEDIKKRCQEYTELH